MHDPDFKALFEAVPGAYLVLAPDFRIVAVSDAYLSATMTRRDAIVGRPLFDVFPDNPQETRPTGVGNLRASLEKVLSTGQTDPMAVQKYDIRAPDGSFEERHWLPINKPVVVEGKVSYIIHCVEDVTDFVALKQERVRQIKVAQELQSRVDQTEKLHQAHRMQAMGQLAGGVAHDFNNMLAVILVYCDLILKRSDPGETARGLAQIRATAEKGARLTHQLLAFSRKQVLRPAVLSVNTVLRDMDPILRRVLNESITVEWILDPDTGNILADVTQIEQVLLNLAANARDAMPGGGTITFESHNVQLDQVSAGGDPPAEPGEFVSICVRDTGLGMDATTQARLFEPFFTTKGAGKGTGLGLAIVHGIVAQNKGTILVKSELQKGTAITVFLPRVHQEVARPAEKVLFSFERRCARILVVEDDPELRDLIGLILSESGFEVERAVHGREALARMESASSPFDLIVSDAMMPSMTGPAMRREMERRGFRTPILFISGYTDETVDAGHFERSLFLEKPFRSEELLEKVQTLLQTS